MTDPFAATVTVIDTRTFEIVTVIPVGFLAWDATLSPDESVLYVATDAGVDVIDTATNTVTTTIPVGVAPQSVAFTPDGTRAYVTNILSDTVSVIDTATNTVVGTIFFDEGSFPNEVAVSPNGARTYVTASGSNTVSVIDTATNTVVATVPVGVQPFVVAVTPDSTRAYVSNGGSNTVSVIDTATNTVIATIPVGNQPQGIDVAPEGSKVYVAIAATNSVAVIDVASNTVTQTLPTDLGSPLNLEVTARRVYVSGGSGHLSVIDRVVEAVIKTVSTASDPENPFVFPFGLAVSEGAPLPGNPTITTQASPSNLAGTLFSDTATVTGGVNPTGEVIFRTYRNANCVNEAGSPIIRPLVNGTATAEAFLPEGTIYWHALYTGDANNNPATHPCDAPNESVVVRPFAPPPFTRVITGDLAGPVTVNNGDSVQIINARVVGPITVNPGGSLVVVNSQISGGIVATSPGFLRICGSQVAGPAGGQALGVFDADLPIIIGDAPNGCAGTRFAGNVNLIGNFGSIFNNNIVNGSLTVNNGGPGTTQLRSNTIYANLACSGNIPFDANRPLNRNTVVGTRSGQCVAPF